MSANFYLGVYLYFPFSGDILNVRNPSMSLNSTLSRNEQAGATYKEKDPHTC